jgi:hypothetical protein
MGLSDQPFEVMCPDCGGMLKVDPVTRSVIAHKSAPKKKMAWMRRRTKMM